MPRWKPRFESKYGGFAHKTSSITLALHTGTHIDAPLHYVADGPSIEMFPLELAFVEAWVVDLTDVAPNHRITVDDIAVNFPEGEPEAILLRTDWPRQAFNTSRFWSDSPFICEEAAEWLASREIRIIGYDFPQEEAIKQLVTGQKRVSARDFTVHHVFLSRGIWQIEYLTNLNQLGCQRIQLVVSPLSLVGLEASPVRVLGRCYKRMEETVWSE